MTLDKPGNLMACFSFCYTLKSISLQSGPEGSRSRKYEGSSGDRNMSGVWLLQGLSVTMRYMTQQDRRYADDRTV
jgi:hypothetical protein